jgi:quinol---cytochrome c reductase iron-sulfur subunit
MSQYARGGEQPQRRSERFAERTAGGAFILSALAAMGLAAVYALGGQPQLEGALLGTSFAGLAYGLVTWANRLMPEGPFVEERHVLPSSDQEREAFEEDLEAEGQITRRGFLWKTLLAAAGAMGVAALFPIRSLGPNPRRSLLETPWRNGSLLVTDNGQPVRASDVPPNGLVTVFPEGHAGSADGQAVLVRVDTGLLSPRAGREDWSPEGLIAYSKVCTHAGCPVGLYQAETHQLLCPCHQSAFDVLDEAKPVFGPAAAALPQLPIRLDADGFLRARSDFPEPVGPSFWRHT